MKTLVDSLSLRRLVLICILAFWTMPGHAATDLEELKQLVKTIFADFQAGKLDLLIAHTHPALYTQLGGLDKAKTIVPKLLRADVDMLEQAGFKITSYESGEPEAVRTEGEWTFVLLPTTLVAEGDKGKLTVRGYSLASRKTGEPKWYLLNLGLPEARVRQMLPELPADFKYPQKQPPKFDPR